MSDDVARLNAALHSRYAIGGRLGDGGMATFYIADNLRHEARWRSMSRQYLTFLYRTLCGSEVGSQSGHPLVALFAPTLDAPMEATHTLSAQLRAGRPGQLGRLSCTTGIQR